MRSYYRNEVLTKDTLNGRLFGVCAGVARHYNKPVFLVRASVVGFGLFFPAATVIAYVLASFLLPNRTLK